MQKRAKIKEDYIKNKINNIKEHCKRKDMTSIWKEIKHIANKPFHKIPELANEDGQITTNPEKINKLIHIRLKENFSMNK